MPRQPEPEVMDILAEAEAYARADFRQVNEAFVERLVELTGPISAARALDLGTGPGDIPIRLCRKMKDWHVVALDASSAMLSIARLAVIRARLSGRIELVLADAKDTHLPGQSFDAIFSNSILHHINDPGAFWAELKRLVRPGAVVLVRDLARPGSPYAAQEIVQKYSGAESALLKQEFVRSLLAAYTPDEIRAQLAAAGLGGLEVAMFSDRHVDVFGKP